MKDRPTSLKDIANALGVSFTLVSRVVRGQMGNSRARPEVVEAILKKAREMDYQPHLLADALRRGRTGTVGVIIHPIGEAGTELAANLLHGISAGLEQHRLRLWLRFYKTDEEFLAHLDKRSRFEMDGLIVVGLPHEGIFKHIIKLHDAGMPVVSVFESLTIPNVANVSPDIKQQGYLATDHLLSLGCKRIAHFVTSAPIVMPVHVRRRHHGYREAHVARGCAIDPELQVSVSDYKISSGRKAVRQLLDKKIQFDGIVAQSDHQAIGAIHELLQRGIRVPEDIKVVGVDDSPACITSPVPLSSVTAEPIAVGRLAADMIVSEINKEAPQSTMIPPHLVVRRSSDPCAVDID